MRSSILLLCALLAPSSAFATSANFQYDYLELGHMSFMPQDGQNGTGPFAAISYTFLDALQFHADYAKLDYPASLSAKDYDLGFTGESAINDVTDVYTNVLYVGQHLTQQSAVTTNNGYRLEVGLRHQAWELVEVDGYLAHNFQATPNNEVGVGVLIDATHWLAFGVSYAHDSAYNDTLSFRVRLYF